MWNLVKGKNLSKVVNKKEYFRIFVLSPFHFVCLAVLRKLLPYPLIPLPPPKLLSLAFPKQIKHVLIYIYISFVCIVKSYFIGSFDVTCQNIYTHIDRLFRIRDQETRIDWSFNCARRTGGLSTINGYWYFF